MNFLQYIKKSMVGLSILSVSLSLHAMQPHYWRGRVVPVAFNKTTQEWNILLGHDRNGYWSDFSLPGQKGVSGDLVAEEALSFQTNGFYSPSLKGTPWAKTPTDDIFHVVKVRYTDAKTLRAQASNKVKDDFAWIPYAEFFNYNVVKRPLAQGTVVNVSYGVQKMIKAYLPSGIKLLAAQHKAKAQPKTQTVSSPQGTSSWFGIPGAIYFYIKGKPYYEFTNFAEGYPFKLNGEWWMTSEQYYQAQKFVKSPALYTAIRDARTDNKGTAPKKAFDTAQANKAFADPQWNTKSLEVMRNALKAKFDQNPALAAMLKNTGNAVLVEDSPVDEFFGVGKQGIGKNHLGKLLMELRKTL